MMEIYLHDQKLQFVCFAEHWFPKGAIETATICNFKLIVSYSRRENGRGGCAIYASSFFSMRPESLNVEPTEKNFEYCCGSFLSNDTRCLVVCVYRSPSGKSDVFLWKLYKILDIAVNNFGNVLVCEDFNVEFNDGTSGAADDLLNMFSCYDLVKYVDFSMRYNKCIDNIFGNIESSNVSC